MTCTPCDGGDGKNTAPDPVQVNLLALLEEIRADHRRWEAARDDRRPKGSGESEPAPPDKLDVRLWPAVAFAGPPGWVFATLVLVVVVLLGIAFTAWRVALRRIDLLRGIWADSKEVNEWRGKLGSAIAGVTKLALWVPALVVAVVLLAAVGLYRGTSCAASGCGATTAPSVGPASQTPVVVYVPASGAPPSASAPDSTKDASSQAAAWQWQAGEWRREAAAARSELAALRSGAAEAAASTRAWLDLSSLVLGAIAGGLVTWLLAAGPAQRRRAKPERNAPDGATRSKAAARAGASAGDDPSDADDAAEHRRLLQRRADLWRDQIASAWKRLEASFERRRTPDGAAETSASAWLAELRRDASRLQRRLEEIIAFTSRSGDDEP